MLHMYPCVGDEMGCRGNAGASCQLMGPKMDSSRDGVAVCAWGEWVGRVSGEAGGEWGWW